MLNAPNDNVNKLDTIVYQYGMTAEFWFKSYNRHVECFAAILKNWADLRTPVWTAMHGTVWNPKKHPASSKNNL